MQFWNPNVFLSPKVGGQWWVNHSPVYCKCWALVFNHSSLSTRGLGADCAGFTYIEVFDFWMKWNMRQNCFSALATGSEFQAFPAADLFICQAWSREHRCDGCWGAAHLKSQSRLSHCGPWDVSQLPAALFAPMMESSTYIKVPGQPVICEARNIVLAIRNVCETKHVIHNLLSNLCKIKDLCCNLILSSALWAFFFPEVEVGCLVVIYITRNSQAFQMISSQFTGAHWVPCHGDRARFLPKPETSLVCSEALILIFVVMANCKHLSFSNAVQLLQNFSPIHKGTGIKSNLLWEESLPIVR